MEEPARRPAPVTVVSEAARFARPEALYRAVREREGRFWADADVARLPHVPPGHPQAAEWRLRRQSADRLLGYLSRLGRPQRLLDLGCGNGWLANALACAGHTVYAVDLNHHELAQGARVFGAHPRLQFLYADVFEARLQLSLLLGSPLGSAPAKLDGVIIASAVQYFPDVRALIERLFELLEPGGQIHLLDSPFYTPATVAAARARTRAYYEQLGFPAMLPFYHHHLSAALSTFNPVQHHPEQTSRLGRWFGSWRRRATPFPWYVITKP